MIGTKKQIAYAQDIIAKTEAGQLATENFSGKIGAAAIEEARTTIAAADVPAEIKAQVAAMIDTISDHAVFWIIGANTGAILEAVECKITGEQPEQTEARRIVKEILA